MVAVDFLMSALESRPFFPIVRSGVATNHLSNNLLPLVWPGPPSPAKVYKKCPLYSIWFPLAVVSVVSLPWSEEVLAGALEPVATNGGHFLAHEPVQAGAVAVSSAKQ